MTRPFSDYRIASNTERLKVDPRSVGLGLGYEYEYEYAMTTS